MPDRRANNGSSSPVKQLFGGGGNVGGSTTTTIDRYKQLNDAFDSLSSFNSIDAIKQASFENKYEGPMKRRIDNIRDNYGITNGLIGGGGGGGGGSNNNGKDKDTVFSRPIALMHNYDPESDKLTTKEVFISAENKGGPREIKIDPDSKTEWFEPVPLVTHNQTWRCFVSGMSGSGKSTKISELISSIRKHVPSIENVFMFNANEIVDPVYEDIGVRHLEYVDVNLLKQLKVTEFKNSIVIFDDWDQVTGFDAADIISFMRSFLKALLERGRKMNIHVVVVNHQTMDYHKTRDIIYQCQNYQLFPSMNKNATLKFIDNYFGKSPDLYDIVKAVSSGADGGGPYDNLYLHKDAPMYAISDRRIKLFD